MNKYTGNFNQKHISQNSAEDAYPVSPQEVMSFLTAVQEVVTFLSKAFPANPNLAVNAASWLGSYSFPKQQWSESFSGTATALTPLSSKQIQETITDEYIVCLEDGTQVRSLRSKLRRFGLTPEQYRAKWGLPASYPMVAPALSALRSGIARKTKPHLSKAKRPVAVNGLERL